MDTGFSAFGSRLLSYSLASLSFLSPFFLAGYPPSLSLSICVLLLPIRFALNHH